jgi:AcrR family transcriptional regulator
MADPRIQRTRTHVLAVARRLLSEPASTALTFTVLSVAAQVSRRTLYTHWGSIDGVISEAVSYEFVEAPAVLDGLEGAARIAGFLRLVRDRMAAPITAVAVSGLIAKAHHDPAAAEALREMSARGRQEFSTHVEPITADQYEVVIGPIFHAEYIARATMTDDQLIQLANYVVTTVGITV